MLGNANGERALLKEGPPQLHLRQGQSELTATNAPVGRSVHWMPCIFFIRRRMGFMTVHFFLLLTIVLFFLGSWLFFHGHDLTHSYPAHFPTLLIFLPS
jgi:hypothetical protein